MKVHYNDNVNIPYQSRYRDIHAIASGMLNESIFPSTLF